MADLFYHLAQLLFFGLAAICLTQVFYQNNIEAGSQMAKARQPLPKRQRQ